MKTTTIKVIGFNCEFELSLKRKDYMSIEKAEEFIFKEITDTAFIKEVVHHKQNGNKTYKNQKPN